MIINVHAGHNPDGRVACGAIGIIRESTEARRVKDAVISGLRQLGHTVYDCTCENGTSQVNVLSRIVVACNAHKADLDVSIHFNSGARDAAGNGRTTGTEVLVYSLTAGAINYARQICEAVSTLGYKNRGVKARPDLSVLRNTKAPALLVECCFVDDKDDVQLYDCQKMADAIVYGITGQHVESVKDSDSDQNVEAPGSETPTGDKKKLYRVQVGAYSVAGNAVATQAKLKAAGFDAIIVSA
ncbi:MAG: N-acetylmuramoyl-L-alanine amidase [Lachnospiraceae bacterium]|nr:N-acetylmuramoyl-L-alanine amidase [Lachnospiraceae bacterium]